VERDDDTLRVGGVTSLERASPADLALLADPAYVAAAASSQAAVLLVSDALAGQAPDDRPSVVVADAHAALIPVLEHFYPTREVQPGVHPTAVLGRGVQLGEHVSVGPYAVLDQGAVLGDRVRVGAHAIVGQEVRLGDDTVLHPHVVLYPGTELGARVIVHAGARLGVDGFGYAWVDGAHRKVPQVGRCIVEDDVEIGANSTIDRGSIGETRVGRGSKLDNLVHLGHNVWIGPHCAMASMVGVAGSVRIGAGVLLAGQAGVSGHLSIGDGARIGAAAKVWKDVPAGETYLGDPARPRARYLRTRAHVERLPNLLARVKALEAQVEALRDGTLHQEVPGAETESVDAPRADGSVSGGGDSPGSSEN
jgi:UDP-3-O-[3-hydroxymyristoyl] glucosamine N-acyltransferase